MKKLFIVIFALICCPFILNSQELPATDKVDSLPEFGNFDKSLLHSNIELARELVFYDKIAWHSSDVAVAEEDQSKMGSEWFCFQDKDSVWHAVYGNFKKKEDQYEIAHHYILDKDFNITKTDEVPDTLYTNRFARAIHNSLGFVIKFVEKTGIKLNFYTIPREDKIELYMMPSMPIDGRRFIAYGTHILFVYDKWGSEILEEQSEVKYLSAVPLDTDKETVVLDFMDYDTPPLNAIFFAFTYKDFFKNIVIICKESSTLFYLSTETGLVPVTTILEEDEIKKHKKLFGRMK